MHVDITPYKGFCFDLFAKKKESDKKAVGFFKIVVDEPKTAIIYYMYIKPKYRHKGYGKKMLAGLKDKFSKLSTQINASSKDSISFLKYHGFKEAGNWLVWTKTTS